MNTQTNVHAHAHTQTHKHTHAHTHTHARTHTNTHMDALFSGQGMAVRRGVAKEGAAVGIGRERGGMRGEGMGGMEAAVDEGVRGTKRGGGTSVLCQVAAGAARQSVR